MSHPIYDNYGEARWYGTYAGTVVNNVDPEKRGRVTILIPGMCEPATNWALPAGGAGSSGASGLGGFDVPPKGAAVFVQFLCGDVDEPVYMAGWRGKIKGKTDAPKEVQDASAADAANKLKIFETEKFMLVIDERTSSPPAISLRAKGKDNMRLEIREDRIMIGKNAKDKLVLGSTWWQQQDLELTKQIIALRAQSAVCVGPLAAMKPGIEAQILALQNFQQLGAGEGYLSHLPAFTE